MTFYSLAFLLFFVISTIIVGLCKEIKWQRYCFLIANVVFYSFWDYRFLLLLFAVILVCYFAALLYKKNQQKIIIDLSVIFCIVVLGVFKYFDFFSESFAHAFGATDYVTLNLVLPLGISFYLFQAMSYLFDVKSGKIAEERDIVKLAVYISFFPQITSGPIVKSKDFLPQLDVLHRIKKENVYYGVQLFLLGLTKKVVFADRIGVAVNAVYTAPKAYNGISVILAVLGYAIQIYCDFSGYSNMAIGIAKIWDFDLGENFNAPYIAKNPSDFWRRWHMSLSTWFRDYVYIPLGGSRKGRFRTYVNLFITMVVSGIWHGANYTYLAWGVIHGLAASLHRLISGFLKNKKIVIPSCLCIIANFIFVSLAWIVFRAKSLSDAMIIFRSMFNVFGIMYVNVFCVIYLLLFLILNIFIIKKNGGNALEINLDLDLFRNKLVIAIWIWLIALFMYTGNTAFIYAQF